MAPEPTGTNRNQPEPSGTIRNHSEPFGTKNKKLMNRQSLDTTIIRPQAMASYLANYGWHFNKKACDYAVSMMRKKNTATNKLEPIEQMSKDAVIEMLTRNNITLENDIMHDSTYVANMLKSDMYRSSIPDEQHLALGIKDIIDDQDAADGEVMSCWYAKMIRRGIPVDWEQML